MAKSDFGNKQELQEFIDGLQKVKAEYNALNKLAKELASSPGKAQQDVRRQIKALNEQYESYKSILNSIKDAQKELDNFNNTQKKITKDAEKSANAFDDMVDSFGELEGLQHSISAQFGKNHVQTKAMQAVVEKTKAQYNGIQSILNNSDDIQQHQKDTIQSALEIYKNFPVTLNDLNKQLKRNQISQNGVNTAVITTVNEYSDFINQLDTSNGTIALIKQRLEDLLPTMDKFRLAAESSKKEFEGIDAAAEGIGFFAGGVAGGSAIVSNAADITKNMLSGTDLKTMSLVGLVVGMIELQAQLQGSALALAKADNAIEEQFLKSRLAIHELNLSVKNGLVYEKALIDFKYQMEGLAASFNAASQTAFFGTGLGSVPYSAAQLELAGINASTLSSAVTDLATNANTGIRSLGYQVAVFAAKTGIAASEFGSIMGYFRMLDKSNGMNAMVDVSTELRKASEQGFNPADIAAELKDSGELALEYHIKSGAQLVKQVKSVKVMGASFSKISEAGKSMVLNYKDSIRKEMQLSAMLGENVDLSEARALFNAGRNDEALASLKKSGIYEKAAQFGLIGTNMLSETLGGMGMSQLAGGKYEKESFKMPTNQEFLDRLTEAQKNLTIDNAVIDIKKSARMAEFDAKETMILRGDKRSIELAGKIIQQDAQSFLKEQYAKLLAGGEIAVDAYNTIKENLPYGAGNLLPDYEQGPGMWMAKKMGMYSKSTGRDYLKNPVSSEKIDYYPGVNGMTSTQAAVSNLTPGAQKFDFTGHNKFLEVQKEQTEQISKNSPIQTKVLQMAAISLKSIDTQSTLQTQLLQNIQALTAATSGLANIGMGDMKLLLDGKEVKSRIEKIYIKEKGKTKAG